MDTEFQLILFPGLGADHRLLTPQLREFPQLVVPAWIPPRSRTETLPEYAARMAENVKPSRDRPLVLGGVSFGGMLAYEMARHLKPEATVLIASCRSPQALRPTHYAARRLLPLLPVAVWEIAKLLARPVVRLRFDATPNRRDLAVRMFRESDSRFMHWTLQAILNWEPAPLEGVRVLQIHGRRDLMIPARRVEADEIIEDGGHLINVTHAKRVNAFIRSAAVASKH
jgi:pimeloyl-ACP methyl ester carboxylesterase